MSDQFKDNSRAVMAAYDRYFQKQLVKAAERVRTTAHDLARKDIGNMANSIFYKTPRIGVWKIYIISLAEYSIWNELGTHNKSGTVRMSAQPFMFPGIHSNQSRIRKILQPPKF